MRMPPKRKMPAPDIQGRAFSAAEIAAGAGPRRGALAVGARNTDVVGI